MTCSTQIKAMVDRHIEKMIATLREKAQHEKEPLTKTLVDYKQFTLHTYSIISMTCTYLRLYVPIILSISESVTFLWLYLIEGNEIHLLTFLHLVQ
jgi:hypothetical protein